MKRIPIILLLFVVVLSMQSASAVVSADFGYDQVDDTHILLSPVIVGFTERSGDLSVTYSWKVDNATVSRERAPMLEVEYDGKLYETFNITFEVCDSFNCTISHKDVTLYRWTWITGLAIAIAVTLVILLLYAVKERRKRRK